LNIQAIARRTGIPSATLRKWEQRYGVLRPERTAGAHRRYSERDVLRVEWLKARLAEGYRIGEAARLLIGRSDAPPETPGELVEGIVAAAVQPDPDRVVRIVDQAFALLATEEAITEVVGPALTRIGDLWSAGEATPAEEHHLTEVVRGKLVSLLDGAVAGTRGRVVLACVPEERHECGLLALAVLLHADGWQVVYLGADTPLDHAFDLAESLLATVIGLSATLEPVAARAEPELERLAAEHPSLAVVRGGAAWNGDSPRAAVEKLARYAAPRA
jgi:MerR family transcriptional regulator, light-induced transcriptional regulator